MKAFAVRLLSVLITTGLVWLPAVVPSGAVFTPLAAPPPSRGARARPDPARSAPPPRAVHFAPNSAAAPCAHNRKEIVMKGFAARLLRVLTLAISAGLVWLPT